MFDRSLIAKMADRYSLPPAIVEAVIQVESAGNPWAIRHEPAFYDRYVKGKGHKVQSPCSRDTEERARAMSFGLMQVMGQTAREEGFSGTYIAELCDPAVGIEFGCKHLATHASRFPAPRYGWDAVCAAYNGGAGAVHGPGSYRNPEYPSKILRLLGGKWPAR